MNGFNTVKKAATASITEKKSEFIASVAPVCTDEEATAFVESVRKKHPSARHNVYACILKNNGITRYSDDGEPHGTAGFPVFNLLQGMELFDTAVVVTRYFGGILLGKGGLVRAYTAAAKAGLEASEVGKKCEFSRLEVFCGYSDYSRLESFLSTLPIIRLNSDFHTEVTLEIAIPSELKNGFLTSVTDITDARARVTERDCFFDFVNIT